MCQGEALISVYVVCRFFEDERHIPDVQERQMSRATRQVDVRLALLQCSAPLHTTVEILKLPYEWKMATLKNISRILRRGDCPPEELQHLIGRHTSERDQ